jgi:hypothetical protein
VECHDNDKKTTDGSSKKGRRKGDIHLAEPPQSIHLWKKVVERFEAKFSQTLLLLSLFFFYLQES